MKKKYEITVLTLYCLCDKILNENEFLKTKMVILMLIILLTGWLEQRWAV